MHNAPRQTRVRIAGATTDSRSAPQAAVGVQPNSAAIVLVLVLFLVLSGSASRRAQGGPHADYRKRERTRRPGHRFHGFHRFIRATCAICGASVCIRNRTQRWRRMAAHVGENEKEKEKENDTSRGAKLLPNRPQIPPISQIHLWDLCNLWPLCLHHKSRSAGGCRRMAAHAASVRP